MYKELKRFFNFFSKSTLQSLRYLPRALSKVEKVIVILMLVALVFSGFFIWRNSWMNSTDNVPSYGGTYTEAIVGESKDLEKHLARLTNAGLTKLEPGGEIKGDIAESWEIVDENKTYKFKLREGFFSGDLAAQIANKNIWSNIEIATPSENEISFKFKQPFSPFLYASTEPIFNYGPYKISKEEKNKVTLEAREDYWQGRPFIKKIVLELYSSEEVLLKDAKKGKLTAYAKTNKDVFQPEAFRLLEMPMPREVSIFFNLSKDDLKNIDFRRNLKENKPLSKELNLTLVTSEKHLGLANDLKTRWKELKVNLEIKSYNNIELQKDIIPKKDYDLLLFGLDYGTDPDPYPFWHSSQIGGGMNLSKFSNKKADILLEEARQTFDFKVREDKYNQFRQIIDQEVPYIVLKKETYFYAVSNEAKGLDKIYGYSEADRFLRVNSWYLKSKRVKSK